jgi:hypothetical protein
VKQQQLLLFPPSIIPDVRTWQKRHIRVRDFLYFYVLVFRECVDGVTVSELDYAVSWRHLKLLISRALLRENQHTCSALLFVTVPRQQIIGILIYTQQDAMLHSLFYLETALHVSGGTPTHHQERIQLYLQHLVFVTPLLLPV